MNNHGTLGISAILLLISILIFGATATSVLLKQTDNFKQKDLEQMIETISTKYTTYVHIEEILGQYSQTSTNRRIQKIAILIEPLFTTTIDLSQIAIKINTGTTVQILYHTGTTQPIQNSCLFSHPLWNTLSDHSFSSIVIHDADNSLTDYNILNDHTDLAYILIKIPDELYLTNGDHLSITFLLPTGIIRTITFDIPFSTQQIIPLI